MCARQMCIRDRGQAARAAYAAAGARHAFDEIRIEHTLALPEQSCAADVYKRQIYGFNVKSVKDRVGAYNDEGPPVPIPNTVVKLIRADNTPVSYTHLDVYKRQAYGSQLRQLLGAGFSPAGD